MQPASPVASYYSVIISLTRLLASNPIKSNGPGKSVFFSKILITYNMYCKHNYEIR